jgi:hypothetical protein
VQAYVVRHGVIPQEEGRRRAVGVGGPPGNSEEYGLNKTWDGWMILRIVLWWLNSSKKKSFTLMAKCGQALCAFSRHSFISASRYCKRSLIWKKMAMGCLPKSRGKGKRSMFWSTSKTLVIPEPLLVVALSEENLDHLVIVKRIDLNNGGNMTGCYWSEVFLESDKARVLVV